jgi:hypothetical protein
MKRLLAESRASLLTAVSSYKRPLDMYVTVHKISNETVIEREMINDSKVIPNAFPRNFYENDNSCDNPWKKPLEANQEFPKIINIKT